MEKQIKLEELAEMLNESKGLREHEDTINDLYRTSILCNFSWREQEGKEFNPDIVHDQIERIMKMVTTDKYLLNFLVQFRSFVANAEYDRITNTKGR